MPLQAQRILRSHASLVLSAAKSAAIFVTSVARLIMPTMPVGRVDGSIMLGNRSSWMVTNSDPGLLYARQSTGLLKGVSCMPGIGKPMH